MDCEKIAAQTRFQTFLSWNVSQMRMRIWRLRSFFRFEGGKEVVQVGNREAEREENSEVKRRRGITASASVKWKQVSGREQPEFLVEY